MTALGRAETLFFCTLCATGLWGQAGRLLPAPFDDWHAVPYRAVGQWLVALMPASLTQEDKLALYQALEGYALAFVLPLLMLGSFDVTPARAGLRRPRRRGALVTFAGMLLTLPIGFYLATAIPDPWGSPLMELLQFLSLLPEHFLVFGVFGALLMPARELAWPPRESPEMSAALFTVAALAVIFLLIHVGGPHTEVVAASLVNGLVFAFMTVYSGSIWPAIVAHCTLNLIPMAALAAT